MKKVHATWREWVNLWLVRLGIRRTLPAVWINAVEVRDCGEGLVPWRSGALVRSGVSARLYTAERMLPPGFSLDVKSGWRGSSEQAVLRRNALRGGVRAADLGKAVAGRSGHATGGAVDVVLLENGAACDMGGEYLDFGKAGDDVHMTKAQRYRRALLRRAMRKAGFVNYPFEWWHFSYGDRMWAAYALARYAIYGEINNDIREREM